MVSQLEAAIAQIPRISQKNQWARPYWVVIWMIVTNYSENPTPAQKQDISDFFHAWVKIFPCHVCQEHFAKHLASPRFAKALENRTQMFMFFFGVINEIHA
jgi:hypothetical protein